MKLGGNCKATARTETTGIGAALESPSRNMKTAISRIRAADCPYAVGASLALPI